MRVLFYLVGILRTLSPGDSISCDPERMAPRRRGEEPSYTGVLQQRTGSLVPGEFEVLASLGKNLKTK